jgi:UDPglucose 6-dehydrogenase
MNISVVGTGYVGLVTGTCLAETGHTVYCVDNNKDKVEKLSNGQITIFEPGLETFFHRNIKEGRLHFTTSLKDAVDKTDIIFLALPTPPGEDGSADLQYILSVSEELGKLISSYKVIVDKSTVPVGTAEKVKAQIAKNCKVDFDVVSNPEFLREGSAFEDFMKPDRIIIGTSSEKAKHIMAELYAPFVRQGNPVLFMDELSAEMTKYAANSYLAMRISFMNEMANLCEKAGADVDMVRKGMGSDNRIGKRFLFPGIGYGGSCFPKDVKALSFIANEYDYDFKILKSVMQVNQLQRELFTGKIKTYFSNNLVGKKIALWGIAFKPNTDDIREAPSLFVAEQMTKAGASVHAYDPEAIENAKEYFKNNPAVQFSSDIYDCLHEADALVIVTEWNVFRSPDFEKMKSLLKEPVIFDGRNLFEPSEAEAKGFRYFGVGRGINSFK